MTQNSKLFLLWSLPLALLLLALRYHLVSQAGFPDFDSVRNWEIVQQLAAGDFRKMFHHLSPGLFLLYAPLAGFIHDFHVYIYLNAILNVAALLVLVRFFQQVFALKHWEAALLFITLGTAVFLVYSARFFTIESAGLLIFSLVLQTYYYRFARNSRRRFYQTVALAALGLMFNYKFLLLLPVALVLELWHKDGVVNLKVLLNSLLIVLFPYVLLMVFSVVVGLPFYLFPASYYSVLNPVTENAAQRTGFFRLDVLYYFQYFLRFESPLLWLGVLGFPVIFRRWFIRGFNGYNYLGWVAFAVLGGMSLILKAPRGLLFVYALFYLLGFLTLRQFRLPRWLFAVLVLAASGYNIWLINREIYVYSRSGFPALAEYVKRQEIRKVAGTVGIGLKPYLPPAIT
ncbi:MAG TPA: hypothetical protein VK927_01440, partial [Adhaeribacter sp.]|nr:hypothetical protein [Adhaeribacter sp.]